MCSRIDVIRFGFDIVPFESHATFTNDIQVGLHAHYITLFSLLITYVTSL